nr:Hnrnpa0l protein [Danio rerio]
MGDRFIQLHSSSHLKNLLGAMWKLRTRGNLCDITIQVDFQGELEEFEAHQVVLAASSAYFKTHLLTEDPVNKMFLCDFSPHSFSKFLEYAYSGKMEVEKSGIANILQMAKLLKCQDLVDVCEVEIPNVASEECVEKDAEIKTKHVKKAIKRKKESKISQIRE